MYDVISEVIAFEKKAEQMVDMAQREKERIMTEANQQKEEEYQHFQKDKNEAIEALHKTYEERAKAHIERTNKNRDETVMRLDSVMTSNSSQWADEIYNRIVAE